jgi:hypothetical protein
MAENAEVKLMLVRFETHTETIRTNDPNKEVSRVMQLAAGKVLNIIYDGKIIYTRAER